MRLKIAEHNTIEALQEAMAQTDDKRFRSRLQVILLAREGVSPRSIQHKVSISPKTYYFWVHRYNEGGMQALKETRTTGRSEGNPKYDDAVFIELFGRLQHAQEHWTVSKMQQFVKEVHGVDVPYETMRMRVKRAGLSRKDRDEG